MATNEPRLSAQQKELVAIGASVGTGCHPCLNYHLKAGATASLAGDRLLAAVTSAERVTAEAAEHMSVHARRQLGVEATAAAAAAPLEEELASFGAALGANDLANIERHMLAAVALGVSRAQLQEAIEVAEKVQQNAMRIHLHQAERLLERSAPAAAADQGEGEDECGCQSEAEAAEAAPAASATARRPAGEASDAREGVASGQAGDRVASVVGSMAARLASPGAADAAGRFAAMADCCDAMFEGALAPQLAAAAGVQQPSAVTPPVAADSSKEE